MEDFILTEDLENQEEMNVVELDMTGLDSEGYSGETAENEVAEPDYADRPGDTIPPLDEGPAGEGTTGSMTADHIEDINLFATDSDGLIATGEAGQAATQPADGTAGKVGTLYDFSLDDTDGDGLVDAMVERYDYNEDGIVDQQTTTTVLDSGTVVEDTLVDTNQSGKFDLRNFSFDLDGDGNPEYVERGQDYNDDGVYDSYRIYEDKDLDGRLETMSERYDSNHDGQTDRLVEHVDYDGDGKEDFMQEYAFNPDTGEFIPIGDVPSLGDAIGGTMTQDLSNFEPSADYPDGISGDPASSMEHWEYQGQTNRCALYSQKFVIEEFTGLDIDIEEFESVAMQNGWFDNGTALLHINKMLDYYGIPNEMTFHNDVGDIDACLNDGGRVIVTIDACEIWYGEGDDMFSPSSSANHAVEVIGIDRSDPAHPMVILNDSGTTQGRGIMVPLEDFEDAWRDSECQMIKCYPNS